MSKNKAIYEPGELSRVREKLGVKDEKEAKRMAQLLGGEVGTEKSTEASAPSRTSGGKPVRRETVDVSVEGKTRRAIRRVDVAGDDDDDLRERKKPKFTGPYPGDDPSVPAKLNYRERVKIDRYSAQVAFEIKSSFQVLKSVFSLFSEPVDFVNPRFVTKRMNEYYGKIEKLVTATVNLFPKNNSKRNRHLKRASPFVYKLIETLRGWEIEQIAKNMADLQGHPRSVKVLDFTEILRQIYKPMFLLENLSMENIKAAFRLAYKVLYIESPMDAKEKYQDIIRNIVASISDVKKNVHFGLYPLLMKLISDCFIPYERFFIERRRRYIAFLNVSESEQLTAEDLTPQQIDGVDVETLQKDLIEEDNNTPEELEEITDEGEKSEDPNDPKVKERAAKEEAEKSEQKALDRGRAALETIFPKAGWEKLEEFPDLYPYFANVYSMRHGYELIAPSDPVHQTAVLMNIMDDLMIGLRDVRFSTVTGADGNPIKVSDELGEYINNWRRYIEDSFTKDYLPRLSEYCRMLENSREARGSAYAKKILNELHWMKRLYFLPYYKFESIGPPPFPKQDIIPIYSITRKIRKYLTAVAAGIEQGVRNGGAAAKVPCNGIYNPWENYSFQVPNPVSKRMDALFAPDKRINATLIFFALSTVTVLDNLINSETSWAYGNRPGLLFRSVNDEGIIPQFGVDEKLDADQIFKDSLKKK